jgi:hypothetical protein
VSYVTSNASKDKDLERVDKHLGWWISETLTANPQELGSLVEKTIDSGNAELWNHTRFNIAESKKNPSSKYLKGVATELLEDRYDRATLISLHMTGRGQIASDTASYNHLVGESFRLSLTPKGAVSTPRMIYAGSGTRVFHLQGESVWIAWPWSRKLAERFAGLRHSHVDAAFGALLASDSRGVRYRYVKGGCSFYLPPGTIVVTMPYVTTVHYTRRAIERYDCDKALECLEWYASLPKPQGNEMTGKEWKIERKKVSNDFVELEDEYRKRGWEKEKEDLLRLARVSNLKL